MTDTTSLTKDGKSKVFRRLYIKRRQQSDGLFESSWFEITRDVKKWGTISQSVDYTQPGRFRFEGMRITVANNEGRYNPETDSFSYWYNYANQQRTLVKVETGFLHQTQSSGGVWTNTEYPSNVTGFVGLLAGDILMSDSNEVSLSIQPLTQIFREFPARNITGYTGSMTASDFMFLLRDQTNGSGQFIFRPFFQDTTTNWDIQTTTTLYPNFTSPTGDDIRDANVWDIIEKLSFTENYYSYVDKRGIFRFVSKDSSVTTTAAWHFVGRGIQNNEYGMTIKKVKSYGFKISKYYAAVQLKWQEADTETSYETIQSSFTISADNIAWNYGFRTLQLENVWVTSSLAAANIVSTIFNNVSALKREIEFSASFVPQVDIYDKITISYDSKRIGVPQSLWDLNFWSPAASGELYWDGAVGEAIYLNNADYMIQKLDLNLDDFETTILAREA